MVSNAAMKRAWWVIATTLLTIFCSRAFAWGEMYVDAANLVYPVYQHHQINYCIQIVDGKALGYTYHSVDEQTRMVLHLWLKPVRDLTGRVKLHRTGCSDPKLNLKIYIGPYNKPNCGDCEGERIDGAQRYVKVILQTDTVDVNGIPGFDFSVKAQDAGYSPEQAMIFTNQYKMSVGQVAKLLHFQGVNITSYPVLLHEIGHAFGLCDTYPRDEGSVLCDPHNSMPPDVNKQPHSVMWHGAGFYLTQDDIAGIRALFKRFRCLGEQNNFSCLRQ